MGIVNRRNAVLGWAVWNLATRMAKAKAKRGVPTGDGAKPSWIRRVVFLGVGFAAAAGAAALFWRNKSADETPPPEE
jgi:hypothetical protein